MSENLQKVFDEFLVHIRKIEPIRDGDLIIITVKDRYSFDHQDLYHAIQAYNKAHPELKGMNVPIIILDQSTEFKQVTDTIYRVYCDSCFVWGTSPDSNDTECGNCQSHNTRLFVEIPRQFFKGERH